MWQSSDGKDVVLFPTKTHWRQPSTVHLVQTGLDDLCAQLQQRGTKSIALPHLGCSHGGLRWTDVRPLIVTSLEHINDIEIELWDFDPSFVDPLFIQFRERFLALSEEAAMDWTSMPKNSVRTLRKALEDGTVANFIQLRQARGVGRETTRKSYEAARPTGWPSVQESLFGDTD
jgi:hypothetical protein